MGCGSLGFPEHQFPPVWSEALLIIKSGDSSGDTLRGAMAATFNRQIGRKNLQFEG
jgi:hypothetical protein